MSDSPISAIIVTGHYSAGKGSVARMLQDFISRDLINPTCTFQRDRDLLDQFVLADVNREHSIIKDIGPPLVFDVTDGYLHDQVHRSMIEGIGSTPVGTLKILEIASGPDVPGFGLSQSGAHLVGLVDDYQVFNRTLFVDVFASENTRFRRNRQRPDFVSEDIMQIAASSGGELSLVASSLGNRYWQINNDTDGDITDRVATAYQEFVKPYLERTVSKLEGNSHPTGWRK